jgi:hypothetical protein
MSHEFQNRSSAFFDNSCYNHSCTPPLLWNKEIPSMSMTPQRKLEVFKRRADVAALSLQGWSQQAIAEKLRVTQGTVNGDLKKVRTSWRESAIRDFDATRDLELERLNMIEREAWAAWERSQRPSQSADIRDDQPNTPSRKRIKNQHGDPRFLEIAIRCNEARRKLLGIDAPTKIAPTSPDGMKPFTHEQRQMHINAILAEHFGANFTVQNTSMEEDNDEHEQDQAVFGKHSRSRLSALESDLLDPDAHSSSQTTRLPESDL